MQQCCVAMMWERDFWVGKILLDKNEPLEHIWHWKLKIILCFFYVSRATAWPNELIIVRVASCNALLTQFFWWFSRVFYTSVVFRWLFTIFLISRWNFRFSFLRFRRRRAHGSIHRELWFSFLKKMTYVSLRERFRWNLDCTNFFLSHMRKCLKIFRPFIVCKKIRPRRIRSDRMYCREANIIQ